MYSTDDIKSCIQEWFANACSIKEICETYKEIIVETERQYNFAIDEEIKAGEQE